jgi:hypothetical protein
MRSMRDNHRQMRQPNCSPEYRHEIHYFCRVFPGLKFSLIRNNVKVKLSQ